jgi:enoyl-CoA hydratase
METPVLFEQIDNIAVLTLNRPERRNAISQDLLVHLYNYIERVTKDPEIRVAVLTGAGNSFCSGLDLDRLLTDNLLNPRGDGSDFVKLMAACPKPFFGAVNGHAITGGFEFALNCDFLIASENAKFLDSHAKVAIHPGWGMTQLLQEAIGTRRARQMSFTCKFITAQQALEWGLVNEVVPREKLMDRAMEIARDIAATNQDMLLTMKRLINNRREMTLDRAMTMEREGMWKFLEKSGVLKKP